MLESVKARVSFPLIICLENVQIELLKIRECLRDLGEMYTFYHLYTFQFKKLQRFWDTK